MTVTKGYRGSRDRETDKFLLERARKNSLKRELMNQTFREKKYILGRKKLQGIKERKRGGRYEGCLKRQKNIWLKKKLYKNAVEYETEKVGLNQTLEDLLK